MLYLERKRAERSGRHFGLMLVESAEAGWTGANEDALTGTLRAISASIRDTDIIGWYNDRSSVVGVIFTEIGAADHRPVKNAIFTKITDVLLKTVRADQLNRIRLSFQVMLATGHGEATDQAVVVTLCPDAAPHDRSEENLSANEVFDLERAN